MKKFLILFAFTVMFTDGKEIVIDSQYYKMAGQSFTGPYVEFYDKQGDSKKIKAMVKFDQIKYIQTIESR